MDEVIIGIGINDNKKTWFPMDKRLEMIRGLFADEPRRVYRARHSYRA